MEKWVKHWLLDPRLLRYLNAANGDAEFCLALYVWNTRLSAALMRDLSDLEVLVRNTFNDAIQSRRPGPHWLLDPDSPLRVPRPRKRAGGEDDSNKGTREKTERAIRDAGGPDATPGKVVAELTFGFWLSLVRRGREHEIWTPYVVHAFNKPKLKRHAVEERMNPLNDLRNRVAHHEHLLTTDVTKHHDWLLELAGWLSPNVADHISSTSEVGDLISKRPSA